MSSLVLGLGNKLSGADAFGPEVLDEFRRASLPDDVDVIEAGTDLLAYLDRFPRYDTIVLVDAVIGADGRQVSTFPEATFSRWNDRSVSAHELSAVGSVKLFRALQPRSADRSKPAITLVALVVPEEDFHRAPTGPEIDAGAAATYLASCGSAGV